MNEICVDNRFEIIEKAKMDILDSTNISSSQDEMKVLDSFLFRCWQMRWLKKYENGQPQTNADRIRAMSDDELADFFFESPEIEFEVCEYCQYFGGHASDTPCKHDMGSCLVSAKNEAFKKWLKQPAE